MNKITFYCLFGAIGLNANATEGAAVHDIFAVCPEKIVMHSDGNTDLYFNGSDIYAPFKNKGNSHFQEDKEEVAAERKKYNGKFSKEMAQSVPAWGELSWSYSKKTKPSYVETREYQFSFASLTSKDFSCMYRPSDEHKRYASLLSLDLKNDQYRIISKSTDKKTAKDIDTKIWRHEKNSQPSDRMVCRESSDSCWVKIKHTLTSSQ